MGYWRITTNLCLVSVLIGLIVSCCTASISAPKVAPEYQGVAPEVQTYVSEWLELAKGAGIKFDRVVTVGFKHINRDRVVGQCNYGGYFREIDLDLSYWKDYTKTHRLIVIWHEASHCYCGRGHDYGDGKTYKESEDVDKGFHPKDGFFGDGCPISILFPLVIEDRCLFSHFSEYTREMFERCVPW